MALDELKNFRNRSYVSVQDDPISLKKVHFFPNRVANLTNWDTARVHFDARSVLEQGHFADRLKFSKFHAYHKRCWRGIMDGNVIRGLTGRVQAQIGNLV